MWFERSQKDPLSNRIDFWIIGVTKPARQLVVRILGHVQTVLEVEHLSLQTLKLISIRKLRPYGSSQLQFLLLDHTLIRLDLITHLADLLGLAIVSTWIVVKRPVLLDGLEHCQIIRLVLDVKLALAQRTLGRIVLIKTSHLPLLSTRQASLVVVLAHCNALIDCLCADAAGEVLFERLDRLITLGRWGVLGTELGLHVGTLGCSARPRMTLAVADSRKLAVADSFSLFGQNWQLQTLFPFLGDGQLQTL
mgnify:CR=1 FL=1